MKKHQILMAVAILIASAWVGIPAADAGDTYVNGYFRANGTYVQPHYRSAPNRSRLDNYSTRGNLNPYTGRQGTVNPYSGARTYQGSGSDLQGLDGLQGLEGLQGLDGLLGLDSLERELIFGDP